VHIVRCTLDAAWYPESDSTHLHVRVIRLDTLHTGEEHPVEVYDRRIEILSGGGTPELLARDAVIGGLKRWQRAIHQTDPF
jgi:hypothetical protein